MIDLETLGTSPGCVVLSIGAVEFDDTDILKTFHVHIDPESSVDHGLEMDVRTVFWWFDQSDEARAALSNDKALNLERAVFELRNAFQWEGKQVWCNGAAFDFPILKAIVQKVGKQLPWAYYEEMDMRTVKNMVGKTGWKQHQVPATLKHDALADAIGQAKTMQKYMASCKVSCKAA